MLNNLILIYSDAEDSSLLVQAVGVPVGRCSGCSDVSGHYFRHYYCHSSSHPPASLLSTFLIEGVLGSQYLVKVDRSNQKPKGIYLSSLVGHFEAP